MIRGHFDFQLALKSLEIGRLKIENRRLKRRLQQRDKRKRRRPRRRIRTRRVLHAD